MATVVTTAKRNSKKKSRMVLRSTTGLKINVQYAPRIVEVTQDGAEWTDSPRPGRYPVPRLVGMKPRQINMELTIYSKDGSSVWSELKKYNLLARSDGSVTIIYTSNEVGQWKVISYSYTILNRNKHDNPTHVTINLTFQRISRGSVYTGPTKGSKKSPAPPREGERNKPNTKSKNKAKTYRVKKGDTLWDIANKFYGNPRLWTRIADANKITNPRLLQIGTVLKIP